MKRGVFILVFLFAGDVFACGEPTSPNGCSPELKYVWDATIPEYNPEQDPESREQFDRYLENYPMRALFDENDKTFWMTEGTMAKWFLRANFGPLTFQKIRVDGTCRIAEGDFQDQNRVKKLTLKIGKTQRYFLLKDKQGVQEFSLKRPVKSHELEILVEKIYPGEKNNNTCITSLEFVTKEVGKWPASLDYLFETKPGEYVYPNYNIFHKGKKRGEIHGDFTSFNFQRDGYVTVSDSGIFGFLFGHFSDLNGIVDVYSLDKKTHPKKMSFIDFDPKQRLDLAWASWPNEKNLCIGRLGVELPAESAYFLLYRNEGGKLKLLKEVKVPGEKAHDAWEKGALNQYCPKLN